MIAWLNALGPRQRARAIVECLLHRDDPPPVTPAPLSMGAAEAVDEDDVVTDLIKGLYG